MAKLIIASIIPVAKYFLTVENFPNKPNIFLKNILMKSMKQSEDAKVRRNVIVDFILDQFHEGEKQGIQDNELVTYSMETYGRRYCAFALVCLPFSA